jgi:hypothetical protein
MVAAPLARILAKGCRLCLNLRQRAAVARSFLIDGEAVACDDNCLARKATLASVLRKVAPGSGSTT